MSRRRAPLRPASIEDLQRRIVFLLRRLPMSAREICEQVTAHPADAEKAPEALRALRESGAVVRDRQKPWLRASGEATGRAA